MDDVREPYLGFHPDAELVLAIVCPIGTDHKTVISTIGNYLQQFGYRSNFIHLSDLFENLSTRYGLDWEPPEGQIESARYKINFGNRLREKSKRDDFLARVAASIVSNARETADMGANSSDVGSTVGAGVVMPMKKTAHIITTLKRPEEVRTLRRIYGLGFFLLGLSPSKEHRDQYFAERGIDEATASALIETDKMERDNAHGQQTEETFHLADVFIPVDGEKHKPEIERFLDLVFGRPTITPTRQEQAMFMAYAASLRSGDLSRQVGAAIIDRHGDLLSVGCNEVPKYGGGVYGPDDSDGILDRDMERKSDPNETEKIRMMQRVVKVLKPEDVTPDPATARQLLKSTGLGDITEFGRTVHAEMDALLACSRTGRSMRDAVLYTTTFPCHNCCRHIIAAGIKEVVYIEPYAKSKAPDLHSDAISIDQEEPNKIPFRAFKGVGPRRYFDLFSLRLGSGYPIERKENGMLREWTRGGSAPRVQLQPDSYLDRERLAWRTLNDVRSESE